MAKRCGINWNSNFYVFGTSNLKCDWVFRFNHYFLCRETGMSSSSIVVFRECSCQYVIVEGGICVAYRRSPFSTRAGGVETFVS